MLDKALYRSYTTYIEASKRTLKGNTMKQTIEITINCSEEALGISASNVNYDASVERFLNMLQRDVELNYPGYVVNITRNDSAFRDYVRVNDDREYDRYVAEDEQQIRQMINDTWATADWIVV
jgi:hypothetical protein